MPNAHLDGEIFLPKNEPIIFKEGEDAPSEQPRRNNRTENAKVELQTLLEHQARILVNLVDVARGTGMMADRASSQIWP